MWKMDRYGMAGGHVCVDELILWLRNKENREFRKSGKIPLKNERGRSDKCLGWRKRGRERKVRQVI